MKQSNHRVVGLDVHPDSFAGAILAGRDPASAQVLRTSTQVELSQLERWAERQTSKEDMLVLEASGNAFAVAGRLRALGRRVTILDSHQAGKIGKVYCANDRLDAIKIARIYLSGLSAQVWQPDEKTLERREVFSAYQGVVKESTRLQQQLKSMLNEHCLRLPKGFRLCHPTALDSPGQAAKLEPRADHVTEPAPPRPASPPGSAGANCAGTWPEKSCATRRCSAWPASAA